MRPLLRVGLGVVCLLAVVLITGLSPSSAFPPDDARWKLLGLQLSDVPRGFVQERASKNWQSPYSPDQRLRRAMNRRDGRRN